MAYSDYEHCPYCVADKQAGRPLPDEHGYKGLYTGDTDVPDHINVICSHHLKMLTDEIATSRAREAQHLADIKALRRDFAEVLRISDRDHVAWLRAKGTMAATAHYDDAKADAGAVSPDCPRESPECITVGFHAVDECERRPSSFPSECPKCQEGTHPFYDVEQARWLCDRCHHPAGEPFVHVDDDHKDGPCGWSGCGRCGDAEGGEG